jgi:hypothetical protein
MTAAESPTSQALALLGAPPHEPPRHAICTPDGRFVAVLSNAARTYVVDLLTRRYLVEPGHSPRGFEAQTLVLEGETRFDPFLTHCELYRIDLVSDRAQWLDFPVSDYA